MKIFFIALTIIAVSADLHASKTVESSKFKTFQLASQTTTTSPKLSAKGVFPIQTVEGNKLGFNITSKTEKQLERPNKTNKMNGGKNIHPTAVCGGGADSACWDSETTDCAEFVPGSAPKFQLEDYYSGLKVTVDDDGSYYFSTTGESFAVDTPPSSLFPEVSDPNNLGVVVFQSSVGGFMRHSSCRIYSCPKTPTSKAVDYSWVKVSGPYEDSFYLFNYYYPNPNDGDCGNSGVEILDGYKGTWVTPDTESEYPGNLVMSSNWRERILFKEQPHKPIADSENRGYLMEFTRINTDCTGRVEYVGGILVGSTNMVSDGGAHQKMRSYAAYIDPETKSYSLSCREYQDIDGTGSFSPCPYFKTNSWLPYSNDLCSQTISTVIPYEEYMYTGHKGYFYGHKLMKGDFSDVTDSLKGFYVEFYRTKNECILGVQPSSFSVFYVLNECYFDPVNTIGLMATESIKVHSWFKIVGFSLPNIMSIATYNNDDCIQKNPFSPPTIWDISFTDLTYRDCVYAGDVSYKFTAYPVVENA